MTSDRQIRLRLTDLHCTINDVLEQMDEHDYRHADDTLHHMESAIGCLRQGVIELQQEAVPA